jgi:hypothetical protein
MDVFGPAELRQLTGKQTEPCVSVYLPTHVSGQDAQQDAVVLKNLLQSAEQQLASDWLRPVQARQMLQAPRDLPNDPAFWGPRSQGLALFVSPDGSWQFRLPRPFDPVVIVNRRFYVKPLLPLLTGGDRFYILALSQNKVRLLSASRHAVEVVDVPDLPTDLESALNYSGADRGSQVHSAMRGSLGKQAAVFHGQGGQPDARKDDLAQYFRLIDHALQPVLRDESVPLLLAGVDYLLPIYREASNYTYLAQEELTGNNDHLSPQQIQQRAWTLMEPVFQRSRHEAAARYRQLAGTGRAADDIRQIVPAAHQGRIEALFVDLHAFQWGQFHPQEARVELHDQQQSGDDDLLDLAATETLLHRGVVYAVESSQSPTDQAAAAVFRY